MKRWLERVRELRKDQLLILLLTGVLLLVIALPVKQDGSIMGGAGEPERESETAGEKSDDTTQSEAMERRLREVLSQVEGIGRAEVMLTFRSDGRRIVEKDLEQSQRTEGGAAQSEGQETAASGERSSSESTVMERDSYGAEHPYVQERLRPEVDGVLVIAQGAGDGAVVSEITEAVMALFGVEAHKIKVMKMK